ncbi:MAG: DegT/DnrJ/EryC1/StrS family aminotransferase [Nanoarchaeota archaeon]
MTEHEQSFRIGVGTAHISPKAIAYVNDVLRSKRLSYGPYMMRFENRFAKEHGSKYAIMSNSGTSALHIAIAALKEIHGWKDGDEVIVPAVTFIATSNVVLHNGLRIKFVDIDPQYYELDPTKLEAAITPQTRAIIPVHLFGQPADMNPIMRIAKKHNLKVIEDSCETMFATYHGTPVGALGDIGCFSTYIAHLITTGVGGLNTTNNSGYAVKLRSIMNHGRDNIYMSIDDDDNKSTEEMKMIIARRFSFVTLGHSFRATEMEGALGLAQVENWKPIINKRRENAAHLTEKLSAASDSIQLPQIRPLTQHSFMMYPIVLLREKKERLVHYLETKGIETRDMLPLTNQPVYKKLLGIKEENYPVAKWINESGFYVGCHQDLGKTEINHIAESIKDGLRLIQ